MMTETITAERLRELLEYDPDTGKFYWIRSSRRGWNGKVAGCPTAAGYLRISIEGQDYFAHRLAWLYMTGELPISDIDHIDGTKDNNCWYNLRVATRPQNAANAKMSMANRSGIKGVSWDIERRRWCAAYSGKKLGRYNDIEDAAKAYATYVCKVYGEFARTDRADAK